MRVATTAAIVGLLIASGVAHAAETVSYTYDPLGRIIRADQTNDTAGHHEEFRYDPAGNRTAHIVDGSTNGSAAGAVLLPLWGGFVVIPIDRQ